MKLTPTQLKGPVCREVKKTRYIFHLKSLRVSFADNQLHTLSIEICCLLLTLLMNCIYVSKNRQNDKRGEEDIVKILDHVRDC